MKDRFIVQIRAGIFETQIRQIVAGDFDVGCQVFRCVTVAANRDNFTAAFAVEPQDVRRGAEPG